MPRDSHIKNVSIAVLPFENFSARREDDYFSLGFVEDLSTDLAHFHNLQVISSYTARKVGAAGRDSLQTVRELAIDFLLQGNMRRNSDQVRISTQLLDVTDGRIIWAERFDVPLKSIFEVQDEIVAQVVSAISTQIDMVLLAAARNKPFANLAAYDCWLRGMDQVRLGTPQADLAARRIFKQALDIDPNYSRAYAGLSLSYFNDWSCQIWDQWEETQQQAYRYALKANQLDDSDHMVQMIMARILLYHRRFDQAEAHADKSLALNSNDADCLVYIALDKTFLGKAAEGEKLFLKALRLNPYRSVWYYPYGAITYFCQNRFEDFIETATKAPLTDVWVDLPAFLAAAYANTDRPQAAADHITIFLDGFTRKISQGRRPGSEEIIQWLKTANPFKFEKDSQRLIQGILAAGLQDDGRADDAKNTTAADLNLFAKQHGLWQMAFNGLNVQMPEVKGYLDIYRLLATPGREIHCTELMGVPGSLSGSDEVLDAKARRAYEARIRELREDIRDAEEMNDLGRKEKSTTELEQLMEHLAGSLGLGKKRRKLNDADDRARAAVTLRIRSAIRKIESAHPSLAKHFQYAIRTGAYCSYAPETEQHWQL